jgi:hypothetical protein
MVHSKPQLQKLSKARMISLISFLLAYLATYDRKAYRIAESRAGLKKEPSSRRGKGGGKKGKKGGGKRAKKGKGKKMSPKLKAFLKKHHRFPKKGEMR